MAKLKSCPQCGAPKEEGCKHMMPSPYKLGRPSNMELIPIDKCDQAHIEILPFGKYPYCNEHGAMLAVEKKCEVWRCITCGLGVKWTRR